MPEPEPHTLKPRSGFNTSLGDIKNLNNLFSACRNLPVNCRGNSASHPAAQRNFVERTYLNTIFEKYIPSFEYEVINLNDYSEEEIMRFGGALSYIFLINKIRKSKEKARVTQLPADYVERLQLQIPEDMHKLLVDVTLSLLDKSGYNRIDAEQAASIVEKAEAKEYGGMFEVAIESIIEEREEAREEGIKIGQERGQVEGRAQSRIEIARNALAEGATFDFVQKITGLDIATLKSLME